MLQIIKQRCYIVTDVFDEELKSLISAGKIDCIQSGISEKVFEQDENGNYDAQAHRGNDRTDTEVYMKMYESIRNKMTQESDYADKGGGHNE